MRSQRWSRPGHAQPQTSLGTLRMRYDLLTRTERGGHGIVVSGMLNRQTNSFLSSGPANHGQIQRGHVMRKMQGRHLPNYAEWQRSLELPRPA